MNRSRLLIGVAAVLAGTTVVLAVAGFVYNLVFVVMAVPFGLAAYFFWADATGRLRLRARRRPRGTGRRADAGSRRRGRREPVRSRVGPSDRDARRTLGVAPDADQEAIRRAYREKVKRVHPDADDGTEEEFKRVTAAYDRLRD